VVIDFERTGGFAATMKRQGRVDTGDLPADQARELSKLVESSGLFHDQPQSATAAPRAADLFHYRLSIHTDDGRQQSFDLPQSAVPQKLWPLLNWLTQRAGPGTSG
jgi:emfourin